MSKLGDVETEIASVELRVERTRHAYHEARKELAVLEARRERMADPAKAVSRAPAPAVDPLTAAAGLAIETLDEPPGALFPADDLAAELEVPVARAERILDYLAAAGQVTARAVGTDARRMWRTLNTDEAHIRDLLARDGSITNTAAIARERRMRPEDVLAVLRGFAARGVAAFADGEWTYVPPGPERSVTRRRSGPAVEVEAAGAEPRNGDAVALTGKARGSTHSPMRDKKALQAGRRIRTKSDKGTRIKGRK